MQHTTLESADTPPRSSCANIYCKVHWLTLSESSYKNAILHNNCRIIMMDRKKTLEITTQEPISEKLSPEYMAIIKQSNKGYKSVPNV